MDDECTDDLNLFKLPIKRNNQTIKEYFNANCIGKSKCKVPIEKYYTDEGKKKLLSISCFDKMDIRIKSGQQSVFVLSAQCSSASVSSPVCIDCRKRFSEACFE